MHAYIITQNFPLQPFLLESKLEHCFLRISKSRRNSYSGVRPCLRLSLLVSCAFLKAGATPIVASVLAYVTISSPWAQWSRVSSRTSLTQ